MKTPNVPIVSTYTPKREICPMILAPTEFKKPESAMMPPVIAKIVRWLAGSRCVENHAFESDVT